MVRGSPAQGKQADFLANISNDGWFTTQEKYQHLQTTVFRCIENRVPMVRCSNTGISAFIDSCGRIQRTVAPDSAGVAVRRIVLDNRTTFYTRHGDAFAIVCFLFVPVVLVFGAAGAPMRKTAYDEPKKEKISQLIMLHSCYRYFKMQPPIDRYSGRLLFLWRKILIVPLIIRNPESWECYLLRGTCSMWRQLR